MFESMVRFLQCELITFHDLWDMVSEISRHHATDLIATYLKLLPYCSIGHDRQINPSKTAQFQEARWMQVYCSIHSHFTPFFSLLTASFGSTLLQICCLLWDKGNRTWVVAECFREAWSYLSHADVNTNANVNAGLLDEKKNGREERMNGIKIILSMSLDSIQSLLPWIVPLFTEEERDLLRTTISPPFSLFLQTNQSPLSQPVLHYTLSSSDFAIQRERLRQIYLHNHHSIDHSLSSLFPSLPPWLQFTNHSLQFTPLWTVLQPILSQNQYLAFLQVIDCVAWGCAIHQTEASLSILITDEEKKTIGNINSIQSLLQVSVVCSCIRQEISLSSLPAYITQCVVNLPCLLENESLIPFVEGISSSIISTLFMNCE